MVTLVFRILVRFRFCFSVLNWLLVLVHIISKSSLAERFSAEFSNLNLVEVLAEFSQPASLREHVDSLSSICQVVSRDLLLTFKSIISEIAFCLKVSDLHGWCFLLV